MTVHINQKIGQQFDLYSCYETLNDSLQVNFRLPYNKVLEFNLKNM